MVRVQACEHCATLSWMANQTRVISLNGELFISFGEDAGGRFVLLNCFDCRERMLANEPSTVQ